MLSSLVPNHSSIVNILCWWPWKSIWFQTLLRTKYVPSLVKIHWRMLILECSQGCYGRTVHLHLHLQDTSKLQCVEDFFSSVVFIVIISETRLDSSRYKCILRDYYMTFSKSALVSARDSHINPDSLRTDTNIFPEGK
jgi:hypothetical protein